MTRQENTMSEAQPSTRPRVCTHGGLARQCYTCELEAVVEKLKASRRILRVALSGVAHMMDEDGSDRDSVMMRAQQVACEALADTECDF